MRNLQTKDLFNAMRIISAMGLRDTLKELNKKTYKSNMELGMELLITIFDKAVEKKSEKLIYEFLAGPFECKASDVEVMDINDLLNNILEVAEPKAWRDFFQKLQRLMS